MPKPPVARVAALSLVLMAVLWGSTFVVIKDVVTRLPVTDMLAVRFGIAALVLLAVAPRRMRMSRRTLRHGIILGLLFGSTNVIQTLGLAESAPSVAGFVTGLYVVFTPLLAALFGTSRIGRTTGLAVVLAAVGLGVLSLSPGGTGLSFGVVLLLIGAVGYAGHIVFTGQVSSGETAMSLALVQTIVVALVSVACALPGGIALPSSGPDWWAVLYLAVICGSLAFFLQIWAQAHLDPTVAAVIMCSEPLWAAVFSIGLGWEDLTVRILLGGIAILTAMMLTSLPDRLFAARPSLGSAHDPIPGTGTGPARRRGWRAAGAVVRANDPDGVLSPGGAEVRLAVRPVP